MKKIIILIDLIIGFFLVVAAIGTICIVAGFLTGEPEMIGVGITTVLTSSVLLVAPPIVLDLLESYLK